MANKTEKQLIDSLLKLKEIKPREEWASLLKSQILEDSQNTETTAQKVNFVSAISALFANRKLAYVYGLSALAILVVSLGFISLVPQQEVVAPAQVASLQNVLVLSDEVAVLNNKISDLEAVSKEGNKEKITPVETEVKDKVSALAKNLKDNPKQDPETIKEIAISLKTLASVSGSDVTDSPEISDLYKAITESQIEDLKETTLTEDQEEALKEIEDLYLQEKYLEALEKILLINK